MEHPISFSLCYRHEDGLLGPFCDGHASERGLYTLIMLMSRVQECFPQVRLVVADHLVSTVEISAAGIRFNGHRVMQEET